MGAGGEHLEAGPEASTLLHPGPYAVLLILWQLEAQAVWEHQLLVGWRQPRDHQRHLHIVHDLCMSMPGFADMLAVLR